MTQADHPIRALIVDDEPLACEGLRMLLESDPAFEIVGECSDGREAVAYITNNSPDVVFLDVQMPEMDGFEVLKSLSPALTPLIVFVTAYDEFAIRAFESHALDYIVKPVNRRRFQQSLEWIKQRIAERDIGTVTSRLMALLEEQGHQHTKGVESSQPHRFPIKSGDKITFVNVADIDWIEAADYYASLHTGKHSHLIRTSLNALMEQLDPREFLRIHRSTIVRISNIKEVHRHFRGDYTVILNDGTRLKLSRSYRRNALSILGHTE